MIRHRFTIMPEQNLAEASVLAKSVMRVVAALTLCYVNSRSIRVLCRTRNWREF